MEHPRPSKRPRRKMQSKLDHCTAPDHHQRATVTTTCNTPTAAAAAARHESPALNDFLFQKRWIDAMGRLEKCQDEAADISIRPSALAVACRQGAPAELIKRLLLAAPHRLRELLDSRGTPLHEAISCELTSMETLRALLRTDELLDDHALVGGETSSLPMAGDPPTVATMMMVPPLTMRATLMQDVDGFTPLHLLIRRRFQWHVLTGVTGYDGNNGRGRPPQQQQQQQQVDLMMPMLEALVESCPESVLVPDRGEYEEPPIVYALKANIYAPAFADGDAHFVTVEARIYEMVQTMLHHAPVAATQTFSGFRGDYTALHSAVFHGRYTSTIELLLDTEAEVGAHNTASQPHKAALLKNTQAELPLHFCAMRGERPRTVALLAENAPQAVLQRDSSGLTPLHWLWIRFMSTIMALEEQEHDEQQQQHQPQQQQRRAEERFDIPVGSEAPHERDPYNDFAILEQEDFETDLRLIRRIDPPVDFLRMRHIPDDVAKIDATDRHDWVNYVRAVLDQVRTRHQGRTATRHNGEDDAVAVQSWTRIQAITALFWTKVVSMLRATKSELVALSSSESSLASNAGLVHAAFASQCCPPPISRLAALLFPHELVAVDGSRRLPVHYAAQRKFHAWDWLREDGLPPAQTIVTAAADLLRNESLQTLRDAIDLSPREAMRVADASNRLVIHHAVATFIHACCQPARSSSDGAVEEIIRILRDLVSIYPECLSRRDGVSMLYPFLQSVACATEQAKNQMFIDQKNCLNITYVLLRENPAVLCSLLSRR